MNVHLPALTANSTFEQWSDKLLQTKEAQGIGVAYLNALKCARNHLIPIFPLPLETIEIDHVQNIIFMLSRPAHNSLSKRTLSGIKHFARQVFHLAIMSRAIIYNPACYVVIPYNAPYSPRNAITEEQQQWVLEQRHRAKRAAMIMLYAGLRRGEVTALQWSDINLSERFIEITKAAEFIRGQPFIKQPKTQTSIRCIDIPQHLAAYLASERNLDDNPYVVHGSNGEMWSKTMWTQIWRSYMKDINIQYGYSSDVKVDLGLNPSKTLSKMRPGGVEMLIETFTPQQLRHTFASNCYFAEVPVEVCRDWMGHADVKTTLNVYTHLDKKYKRQKQAQLDDYYAKQLNIASHQ